LIGKLTDNTKGRITGADRKIYCINHWYSGADPKGRISTYFPVFLLRDNMFLGLGVQCFAIDL
jgi:hypothetical protein